MKVRVDEIVQFNPIDQPDKPALFLGGYNGIFVVALVPKNGKNKTILETESLRHALEHLAEQVQRNVRYELNGG